MDVSVLPGTVLGAVLVASCAKGEKPAVPLNIASVEKMMDTQSSGLVPQNVRERNNKIWITFNDTEEAAKAANVLKKQAECSLIFESVYPLNIYYPVVAHFVDVSYLKQLQAQIEYRNPLFSKKIQSVS
jgi:hypothetical protein